MKHPFPTQGLYAITDSANWPGSDLIDAVQSAIAGGAKAIQYRDKQTAVNINLSQKLLSVCHEAKVPLIVNDNIELCRSIGADGVHIGRFDSSIQCARELLGDKAIIGVSCYNSIEAAIQAQNLGASYVAFGRFYPSISKPDATSANMDVLSNRKLRIPIVAIGGITPINGKALLDAGANVLAVINGIFGQRDPKAAAIAYNELFT